MRTRVTVHQGSLTDGNESVLVNASNTQAELGTGVSLAIRKACGPAFQGQILKARDEKFGGPMPPGEVLLTGAGAHPRAKWVCHAAVMDYRRGISTAPAPSLDRIRLCCERLWDLVERIPDGKRHTVAMVALGAGVGGMEVEDVMHVAAETLNAHAAIFGERTRIDGVTFYGYHDHEYHATARALLKVWPDLDLPADLKSLRR